MVHLKICGSFTLSLETKNCVAWIRFCVGRIRAPRFNSPPSGTNSTTTAVVISWSAYSDAYYDDDDDDDDDDDGNGDDDYNENDEKALYLAFPSV